jgi:hypothetical protein
MVIREMYEVHLEWETRVCPVGVQSLTRQFRRYFDRFEGRIREPPYAVYDDLAYTQGSPPAAKNGQPTAPSADQGHASASPEERVVSGFVTGPNLEEYRERLRGFAMDLGNDDDVMLGVVAPDEPAPTDLGELYNFPTSLQEHTSPTATRGYAESLDNMFSNPFTGISEADNFQTAGGHPTIVSPFDMATQGLTAAAPIQTEEELPDYLFEGEEFGYQNFEDLFADIPEMPDLDGVIDQGFLQFLDS